MASAVTVWGDVQGVHSPPSRAHSNWACSSPAVNSNAAEVDVVVASGPDVSLASGGAGGDGRADGTPVSVSTLSGGKVADHWPDPSTATSAPEAKFASASV